MAAALSLKSIVIPPKSTHTATVLFAHGLGDTGAGWEFLAQQYRHQLPFVKWIFPNAPVRPITLNGGMPMPGWFDIMSLRPPRPDEGANYPEDEEGLLKTVKQLNEIVDAEIKAGIPSERIIVGGFSQGAASSLLLGLTSDKKLGGYAILSGWLALSHKASVLQSASSKSHFNIFMGHGKADQVVQYAWGERSYKYLKDTLGVKDLEFHAYEGLPHSANEQELRDLLKWLQKTLADDKTKM